MLQIFRKDNGGLWGEMRAKKKAVVASAPPVIEDNSGSGHLLDPSLSAGSLENSLFGDKAWGSKLSYTRMRNVLNAMRQITAAGGRSRRGRFSLSGSSGPNLFTSLRRLSLSSAGGRQNSLNSISEENSSTSKKRSLFGCFRRKPPPSGNVSKLNAVLSKYDETEVAPVCAAPLYSAASFSRKPSAKSAKLNGSSQRSQGPDSVVGTTGSVLGSEAEAVVANPRQSRRVSFSQVGFSDSPGGASSGTRKSIGGKVAPSDTASVDTGTGSRKGRRSSNASVSSMGSSDTRSKSKQAAATAAAGDAAASKGPSPGRRASRRGKPSRDEDLSDSDDEGQAGAGGAGAGAWDDGEDRSVVSVTSLLKKMSSFSMLSGGGGSSSEHDPNVHPKHCMCGCRAY